MPFTFKLSQRLARMRSAVLLLVIAALAACEKPTGLTDPAGTLSRLVVSPKVLTLRPNQTADFMAVGLTSTGDTATVAVDWSASGGRITAMSTIGGRHYGHYTATADTGTVKVVAKGNQAAVVDTAVVRVTPVPVTTVTVAPASASVLVGQLLQLSATTADSAGNLLSGRTVTWASSNSLVATVTSTGLLTGLATGTTTITATSEGAGGTAAITVTVAPVAGVSVSPGAPSVAIGGTAQLTAVLRDANGNPLSGRTVTWATSNGGVATVSATGLVTGVAVGGAMITATSEGKSGTATVTVTAVAVPVASVAVNPATPSLAVGGTVQLTATPQDSVGNSLPGRTVTWASSASTVASVSTSGLVTSVAAGTATITATSEGKSGTATVTVTPVPVASVSVSPAAPALLVAATVQLTATPRDASGTALSGRSISWVTSNASAATVSANGLVTGVAAGTATITATSEGKSGTASVTVTTPAPPPPPPPPPPTTASCLLQSGSLI